MNYYDKLANGVTIKQILESEHGSLRLLTERYGYETVESLVVYTIVDLNEFFNYNKKMTERQVSQTAELIITEFQHFTPEDFKRCFDNIKLLKYGELYQSLDGGKIISMMRQYDIDFAQEEIEYRRSKAAERRSEKIEWQPEVTEALKTTLNKINVNKIVDKENQTIDEILKENDNFTKKLIREFDVLFNESGESVNGIKFVRYKEKKYDLNSYLKQRCND